MIRRSLVAVAAVIALSAAAASTRAFVDADVSADDGTIARIAVERMVERTASALAP